MTKTRNRLCTESNGSRRRRQSRQGCPNGAEARLAKSDVIPTAPFLRPGQAPRVDVDALLELGPSGCGEERSASAATPDLSGCPLNPLLACREDTTEILKAATRVLGGAAERVRRRLFQGRLCRTRFQGRFAAADDLVRLTDGRSSRGVSRCFPSGSLLRSFHRSHTVRRVWIKIGLGPSAVLDRWCSAFGTSFNVQRGLWLACNKRASYH